MYVTTDARLGPASAISANITARPTAVQAIPRTTIEPMTLSAGIASGKVISPAGAIRTLEIPSDAATGPIGGRLDSFARTIRGAAE